MPALIVVNTPADWPFALRGVDVVSARQYLTDPAFNAMRDTRVINLCRSYSYQSLGYYVSLLAEARGHKPQPDVITIQDMKSVGLSRLLAEDVDELIQRSLRTVRGNQFTLSMYFGQTLAKRDERLGGKLFSLFRTPLLRAHFTRRDKWLIQSITPIPADEIPESHHTSVVEAANRYFAHRTRFTRASRPAKYDLAILVDPQDPHPPSDELALRRFIRAAARAGIAAELIGRDDFSRVGAFDALFIRVTTAVDHYTFRFSRRAAAEGLAVIDDPVSIARCTNKVYLAERLTLGRIPVPQTVIVHRDNVDELIGSLGLPVVLKQPDSSFSRGVVRADTEEELHVKVDELLEESDLLVAQRFLPTDFDWRVGVLDGQPLYVCRYFMAKGRWQIQGQSAQGNTQYGRVETLAVEDAPRRVVALAVRAARLIGDGLYGVDLKHSGRDLYVMEINDNPSIDGGYEDKILKDELYDKIIQSFVRRIEKIRNGVTTRARE
ncbi:MAG: RimK family protein [Phycisphaeraceae bacterium]|nr:RimK family protein [Phycisphaeraceae bacterium]